MADRSVISLSISRFDQTRSTRHYHFVSRSAEIRNISFLQMAHWGLNSTTNMLLMGFFFTL